jgi:hypothetical protein
LGPGSGLRLQLIALPKTVSAGYTENEQLISAWMISGIERPLAVLQNAPMEPTRPLRRESTAVMADNIGRELRELRAALADSRGDLVAEPRITAAALAHLLLCSRDLLQNLLIDTARRPRRIER